MQNVLMPMMNMVRTSMDLRPSRSPMHAGEARLGEGSRQNPEPQPDAAVLPDDTSLITDATSLRALHHQPMSRATDKVVLTVLDAHCRRIISLSPFCVVATQGRG